jgi:hypothetical protein
MTAYEILVPPYDEYGKTTAWQDVINVLRAFFSGGGIRIPTKDENKERYLAKLKIENPQAYEQYQNAMAKYEKTIGKAKLEPNSAIDIKTSKEYIENTKNLTEKLIKQAIERGDIPRESAAGVYDAWNLLNDVESGAEKLSYQQMEALQKKLFAFLPADIIKENSDEINQYMTDNENFLIPQWEGDSNLGDFDWLRNRLAGKSDEGGDLPDTKPKEKKIEPMKRGAEPKYRYRGKWGNEEELFRRSEEEIERRNLIIEVQRLREDLDTTNKLIQSQLQTEQMRFGQTFNMPQSQPIQNKKLPDKFKREHRAIFTPGVIENPMREFERNAFDECYYGQYQGFYPTIMPTTARRDLLSNPLVYPSNADIATGGELKELAPPDQFNWILNNRFV